MFKRILVAILIVAVCFSSLSVMADTTLDRAKSLYDMGLLKGTGSGFSVEGLELERNANRAEVCTTIVRMLGKEQKAAYQQNTHPFNDVPQWASNNIGWLYENYLVNGVSDTYFGAADIATVQQFATMLLRVLGFDDSKGDFSYSDAVEFAINYGIAEPSVAMRYELSREDMINMCHSALRAKIKNSSRTLIRKLCDEKAVSEHVAQSSGILKAPDISDSFADVPETLGGINVYKSGSNSFCINFDCPVEEYGIRVYVLPEGGVMSEIKRSGDVYMQKGKISYPGGSAAGYLDEVYVHGLDTSEKYSFIVLKTTSEGELYHTTGRSGVAHN